MTRWKMEAPCDNCPFATRGAGLHLRKTLGPGRWREILRSLQNNQHFACHKTTDETGDGSNLMCAGALEWQRKRGLSSNLQRIMERIEYMFGQEKAASVKESFAQIAARQKRKSGSARPLVSPRPRIPNPESQIPSLRHGKTLHTISLDIIRNVPYNSR